MRTIFIAVLITAVIAATYHFHAYGWGFWAHQRINRMAVFCLPAPMFGFFKHHSDYLTIHAVDPDKRRYAMEGEAACHYIDLDRYGEQPFDSIPQHWKVAVQKYSEDTLMAHGIVPWHIEKMTWRLTAAFRDRDPERILKYAAEIGHYIGDAHVPLHCTQNYNGQLTGQHGIHGFWESRIPELLGEEYDYYTGRGKYISNPLKMAWKIVAESYQAHDSVLLFEKELNNKFPADRKYAYEQKGNMTVKVYSREYTVAYDRMLNSMSERRMRDAIQRVASYWYTAWVNAGQPVLELNEILESSDTETQHAAPDSSIYKHRIRGHED
jgi:hypothetical protein